VIPAGTNPKGNPMFRRIAIPTLVVLVLALSLVRAGPVPLPVVARYSGGPVANGGVIKGTVTLKSIPAAEDFSIVKDETTCAHAQKSPRLVVDPETKGLGNVVVWLDDIEKGKPLERGGPYVIDQKECQYHPHVSVVPVDSDLSFGSSDPILHNVHVFQSSPDNPHDTSRTVLNSAMKDKDVPNVPMGRREMRRPGFFYVKCDAGHIWMSAYVFVVEHPYYAITDAKGAFELKDVPPGTYTVKFWHENWVANAVTREGTVSDYTYGAPLQHLAKVTIGEGGVATVDWEIPN